MNSVMAQGMMIAIRGLGVEIDDWKEVDGKEIVYMSVPRDSTDIGPDGTSLAGKKLADRIYTKMHELGATDFNMKYRVNH